MARIHRGTVQKKSNDPDNHDGVITDLEPDILECEVKRALGSITMNKARGGSPGELFQTQKMMLWKCCTQYASKFGKLSSGHRTGKGQFSFQIQRQAMPKNVQITAQLLSSHMTVRLCSKSFKLGFSSTWTENFQMYKLDLEKAEEPELPEIKLPTSVGSEKARNYRQTCTSAHWLF